MTKPSYAVLANNTTVGVFDDLTSALSAKGDAQVYERMGNGARSSEKLAEIVALCQRYSHPGTNAADHALASRILVIAGERGESK